MKKKNNPEWSHSQDKKKQLEFFGKREISFLK